MSDPPAAGGSASLERGLGLAHGTAANLLSMIGVGPFLTIPLMVDGMAGPHILYAWLCGGLLALCDGLVYAELGAALPGSGGPYVYLREAYSAFGLGRLLSFLFVFQVVLTAPLSIAGGAVGFADYLGFYWTRMGPITHDVVAASVCVSMTALLYRPVASVGRITIAMLSVVIATVGWVVIAGLLHFDLAQAFTFPPAAHRLDADLVSKLGAVSLLAMYNYGGYNTICNVGDEVRSPHKTIPRAIVLSIVLVIVLDIIVSTVMIGSLPWQEIRGTKTVASLFIARTFIDPAHGKVASIVMTGLILFVTAASLYALIFGYSRIPFAAARDGQFFRAFARVHPTKHFPHVSLVTLSALSIPFCFLPLGKLVSWLLLVQILLQFIWQCAAVVLLRRFRPDVPKPFKMWLYPVPALVALALWLYVFFSAKMDGILFSFGFLVVGLAAYALFARQRQDKRGTHLSLLPLIALGGVLAGGCKSKGQASNIAQPDEVDPSVLAAACDKSPFAAPPSTRDTVRPGTGLTEVALYTAHPDDESMYAGGTLTRLSQRGHKVAVIIMSHGEGGRLLVPAGDGGFIEKRDLPAAEVAKLRDGEMSEAGRRMGVELTYLHPASASVDYGFTTSCSDVIATWHKTLDGGMRGVVERVIKDIRSRRPRVVITMDRRDDPGGSKHGHHRATGVIVDLAVRLAADDSRFPALGPAHQVDELWTLAPQGTRPDLEVTVDPKARRRALEAHASQFTPADRDGFGARPTEGFVLSFRTDGSSRGAGLGALVGN